MNDFPVELPLSPSYPYGMETRVAVLEQLARNTAATLERMERRLDAIAAEQRSDFRWLLGVILGGMGSLLGAIGGLFGIIMHGVH
jgi:hypothetical protein